MRLSAVVAAMCLSIIVPIAKSSDAAEDFQQGEQSIRDHLRLAGLEQATSPDSAAKDREQASEERKKPAELEEIVVTAEKRTSTVQDTPISITAVTGDQLQRTTSMILATAGLWMHSSATVT